MEKRVSNRRIAERRVTAPLHQIHLAGVLSEDKRVAQRRTNALGRRAGDRVSPDVRALLDYRPSQ